MRAQHFELLVEEPSMEAFLQRALPIILPQDCTFEVHDFHDKKRLLCKLDSRLRGYAKWLPPEIRIIILLDRDREDCYELKYQLELAIAKAGLRSRALAGSSDWQVAPRIVIEELEAWYFGDWEAVRAAYPRTQSTVPPRYRTADSITGGTWEAFERQMRKHGYFRGGLRKVEAAQAIGQHMDPDRNTSHSFRVFRDVLREATA
jgi:hypothetical protein